MHNSIAQPPTAVLELKREVDNNTAQLRQLAVTLPVEIAIAQTVNTQHFDALTFAEIAISIALFLRNPIHSASSLILFINPGFYPCFTAHVFSFHNQQGLNEASTNAQQQAALTQNAAQHEVSAVTHIQQQVQKIKQTWAQLQASIYTAQSNVPAEQSTVTSPP